MVGLPGSPFPPMFGEPKSKTTVNKAKVPPKRQTAPKPKPKPAAINTPPARYPNASVINGNPAGFDPTTAGGLMGPLNLPKGLAADSQFTWDYSYDNTQDLHENAGYNKHPQHGTITTMTMAGGLSYLKQLAVNDHETYNAVVHQLVAAGYLSPADARYAGPSGGGYTMSIGNAFLKSAADVWAINQENPAGGIVRWQDNMNSLIEGRQAAGLIDENGLSLSSSGGGSGGSKAPQGPVRSDKYSNPEAVKASINDAARSVLGRKLNDSEVQAFASAFHAQEAHWNDQVWAGQQAQFNGASSTVQDAPSVAANAKNYVDDSPALGADRTNSLLGSYIGVLRNITGLGSGGVSSAVS